MAAFKTASIIPKRLFFAKSFHISIRSSDFSYCREMHIINNSNNVTQIEAYHVENHGSQLFMISSRPYGPYDMAHIISDGTYNLINMVLAD